MAPPRNPKLTEITEKVDMMIICYYVVQSHGECNIGDIKKTLREKLKIETSGSSNTKITRDSLNSLKKLDLTSQNSRPDPGTSRGVVYHSCKREIPSLKTKDVKIGFASVGMEPVDQLLPKLLMDPFAQIIKDMFESGDNGKRSYKGSHTYTAVFLLDEKVLAGRMDSPGNREIREKSIYQSTTDDWNKVKKELLKNKKKEKEEGGRSKGILQRRRACRESVRESRRWGCPPTRRYSQGVVQEPVEGDRPSGQHGRLLLLRLREGIPQQARRTTHHSPCSALPRKEERGLPTRDL